MAKNQIKQEASRCENCGAAATTRYFGRDMCQSCRDIAAKLDDEPARRDRR
jgi:hypothetical protein